MYIIRGSCSRCTSRNRCDAVFNKSFLITDRDGQKSREKEPRIRDPIARGGRTTGIYWRRGRARRLKKFEGFRRKRWLNFNICKYYVGCLPTWRPDDIGANQFATYAESIIASCEYVFRRDMIRYNLYIIYTIYFLKYNS